MRICGAASADSDELDSLESSWEATSFVEAYLEGDFFVVADFFFPCFFVDSTSAFNWSAWELEIVAVPVGSPEESSVRIL